MKTRSPDPIRRWPIIAAICCLSVTMLISVAPGTAQGTPTADDIHPPLNGALDQYVIVEPDAASLIGAPGTSVTYTLRVTNTSPTETDFFTITVSSLSSNRWLTEVLRGGSSTGVLPLGPGQGEDVQVVVYIPSSANGNESNIAEFRAVSRASPIYSDTALLTTTASVQYDAQVYPTEALSSGDAGANVTHTLRVTNTGNTPDIFALTVTGTWTATVLVDMGKTALIWPPLPRDQGQDVQVIVQIPSSAEGNDSDVTTFAAISQGNPTFSATARLTTRVPISPGVVLNPPVDLGVRNPGDEVTCTLQVTNTGNATDSFTITAAVPDGWQQAALSASQLASITSKASQSFLVTFTVGANVVSARAYSVSITATSHLSPAKEGATSIIITAGPHRIYLPAALTDYPPVWEASVGMDADTRAYAVAACTGVFSNTAYAGTDHGVYTSTNAGANWNLTGFRQAVYGTAVATDCKTVHVATWGQGVYTSRDGGVNWSANSGLSGKAAYVSHIALDPLNSSTIYAGTADGVYISTDGGANWSWSQGLGRRYVLGMSVDRQHYVYAATRSDGVYKMAGGNGIWTALGLSNQAVYIVAIDPYSPTHLLAATDTGVYEWISDTNWISVGLATKALWVTADPYQNQFWAGYDGSGVQRSNDGENWLPYDMGLNGASRRVYMVEAGATYIYAATADKVWRYPRLP